MAKNPKRKIKQLISKHGLEEKGSNLVHKKHGVVDIDTFSANSMEDMYQLLLKWLKKKRLE